MIKPEELDKLKTLLWVVEDNPYFIHRFVNKLGHFFDEVLVSDYIPMYYNPLDYTREEIQKRKEIDFRNISETAEFINGGNFSKIVVLMDRTLSCRGTGHEFIGDVARRLKGEKKTDIFLIWNSATESTGYAEICSLVADELSKKTQGTVRWVCGSDGELLDAYKFNAPKSLGAKKAQYDEECYKIVCSLVLPKTPATASESKKKQEKGLKYNGEFQKPNFKKKPTKQAKPQKIKARQKIT